jgi:hypothetical protein
MHYLWGLTAFNIFFNGLLHCTLQSGIRSLRLEFGAAVIAASRIEGTLEGIALPAEQIISVLAISGSFKKREQLVHSPFTPYST